MAFLAGAAGFPLRIAASEPSIVRRVGVLIGPAATVPMAAAVDAFRLRLQELGWTEGVNVQFDVRWSNSDAELMREHAVEVVGRKPDVIFVQSNPSLAILVQVTRTIPIVFVHVADPVGGRFIQSLARPGGNVTGLTNFEATMGGKWLEVLKEIAPKLDRVMVLRHPETPRTTPSTMLPRRPRACSRPKYCLATCATAKTWSARSPR